MKIKVCGIRTQSNLTFLSNSAVDFIGFIFYDKSGRNFNEGELLNGIDTQKQKVGVFVNESIAQIETLARMYGLDYIQLHGDESPEFCQTLKTKGYKLFKAFALKDQLPDGLEDYEPHIDCFLFDTKGKAYGGNGAQFDWSVLDQYKLEKPFVLSGGIGPKDVESIRAIRHPQLFAVDINSRFELAPGEKDEQKLKVFIEELKK
ncbi:phosphoribosylanthranilate isomerase [Reichenbachiella carrageenanivorans]|uniref:N-(5'-phosphoribosyl)anthranilate isomerase n=1 Tax=Reichenbachiella carrageenanivorans TaxID=2979869 RepID=A0ABY6CZV2_9BACT|nr:phosphoribosylanthranilate isomerase [Reichenbachiella carrageenanivorans]UXX78915.1 phosphoribosylanthranilate isomerase [Reichenbachiella carrageenanivorans]